MEPKCRFWREFVFHSIILLVIVLIKKKSFCTASEPIEMFLLEEQEFSQGLFEYCIKRSAAPYVTG